jgi:riboflavin synthase
MFTGLIEAVGTLAARVARGGGARLTFQTPLRGLAIGESIAVSGCCLTVDVLTKDGFVGARVNLERALTLEKRLGGHLVSGHVDGVGELVSREPMGEAERLVFRAPKELMRFVAPKGSITVDGTSLTVNEVDGDTFSVAIIPRTQKETRIGDLGPGGAVNLEIDLVARYVQRLLETK